jgi:signal transduction histidine kinase/CheY-like chemotaxis protein
MLLHRAAAQACELLDDPASALRHARAEQRLLSQVLGQGAQARRLALEITHRLAQERAQREQAQQRERAAEDARQRLDALNRALAEANQAKTRFLAAASHDLRQPVQALAMNMAALQAEALSTGQGLLVDRMAQSLDALGRMFDVLLDISRLDAGIVPVHAEPLALRPLLHRLVEEHRPAAEAKGLTLRLRLPADAPALMSHSDPVLLERCLRNLLDNALKYTPQGGVLLAVRALRALHGQPPGWRVEIVDTGIGMTPEVRARVFEEFYQADNPERDRSRGLGLGGAIVLRLARLLGHELALRSRPGRGTRVSLLLPSRPEPVGARRASAGPSEMPALCLAVVDDDAEVRDSLVAVLERWGHRALSGVDAEAVLRQWQGAGRPPVHGVLSDLRLRGQLDGRTVVATLRQVLGQPRLPALILTGDVAPERLQGLRDSGLPWLPKPVMPMRLRSWLAGVGAACPQGQ